MWIAMMGCISDHFLPPFADSFKERYPEMWGNVRVPFDAYYNSEIGLLARAISFGLKDSTSHVVYLQNFMVECSGPNSMKTELDSHSSFARKYKEVIVKCNDLLKQARRHAGAKLLFFQYSGALSISSDLANQLSYLYPKLRIAVAYVHGALANLSLRGKNIRDISEKIIPLFEGARGGGHPEAVGLRLKSEDLGRFKEMLNGSL